MIFSTEEMLYYSNLALFSSPVAAPNVNNNNNYNFEKPILEMYRIGFLLKDYSNDRLFKEGEIEVKKKRQ